MLLLLLLFLTLTKLVIFCHFSFLVDVAVDIVSELFFNIFSSINVSFISGLYKLLML